MPIIPQKVELGCGPHKLYQKTYSCSLEHEESNNATTYIALISAPRTCLWTHLQSSSSSSNKARCLSLSLSLILSSEQKRQISTLKVTAVSPLLSSPSSISCTTDCDGQKKAEMPSQFPTAMRGGGETCGGTCGGWQTELDVMSNCGGREGRDS